MKNITLLSTDDILEINKAICVSVNQQSICLDQRKIESALGAAFYPGGHPFQYGGIPKVAGALCFFLIKAHAFIDANMRTAALAAVVLLELNGYDLIYPLKIANGTTAFTDIIEKIACSLMSKDELIEWFDTHAKSKKKLSQRTEQND